VVEKSLKPWLGAPSSGSIRPIAVEPTESRLAAGVTREAVKDCAARAAK
jgi:hypothetical protein